MHKIFKNKKEKYKTSKVKFEVDKYDDDIHYDLLTSSIYDTDDEEGDYLQRNYHIYTHERNIGTYHNSNWCRIYTFLVK